MFLGLFGCLQYLSRKISAIYPVVKHHQDFHGVEGIEDRLFDERPPLQVSPQPIKEGVDVVVQVDALELVQLLSLWQGLTDMLKKDTEEQLNLL